MNPYEKQELKGQQRYSRYYHKNYNPKSSVFKDCVPHWVCLDCKGGLTVIEYCLQCPKCGLIVIKNLWTGWNGLKYPLKSSSYKYELHYKTWINCILARENITPALDKVIKDVKAEATASAPPHDVKSVREVLKKIGHNIHYKHAPLILKKITGIGPPDIPDNVLLQCKSIFSEVVRAYIQCFNTSNAAGYPYIIYKIFDAFLDEPFTRRVLDYIHLPGSKTIVKRDEEWKVIQRYLYAKYPETKTPAPTITSSPVCNADRVCSSR